MLNWAYRRRISLRKAKLLVGWNLTYSPACTGLDSNYPQYLKLQALVAHSRTE